MKQELVDKLKSVVESQLLVEKTVSRKLFTEFNIPSFIRDYFLKDVTNYADESQITAVKNRIKKSIPNSSTWNTILDELKQGKTPRFLARVSIGFDLKNDYVYFQIPEYGLNSKQTYIHPERWEVIKSSFLNSSGSVWGVVQLSYQDVFIDKKTEHRICLDEFIYFAPFKVEIDHFVQLRKNFSTEEWIDVLLSTIDYEPEGFATPEAKLTMLQRLLPFVESRLNLMELAPKGTGKTYIFSQLSNKAWWANGGNITRAKYFYDMTLKTHGLVAHYDVLALDEISSLTFSNESEMEGALKGYLEFGRYSVGNTTGQSNCSFVLLGNIPMVDMSTTRNMVKTLPQFFQNSALLDRFHGFIEGWKIPRVTENMKIQGYSISTEYYSEIMHKLRSEAIYTGLVNDLIVVPHDADSRDTSAIKRLSSAMMKLFFPHWRSLSEVVLSEFDQYCLKPAVYMRDIIKKQMGLIDPQFSQPSKLVYETKAVI